MEPEVRPAAWSPTVSVVVPVYNGEATLATLVERVRAAVEPVSSDLEFVLVNDGSRDGSWGLIATLARDDAAVRGFDLMRNYGQHNALLAGIRAARHEVIVTIDDDLQHPPAEITRLLEQIAGGSDVVYGYPRKQRHSFARTTLSQMTKWALQSTMGVPAARRVSAFRAFRTPVREAFGAFDGSYVSLDVLLSWATTRFSAIPVDHDDRQAGASNYNFRRLWRHAMNMITGFSVLPLRIASLLGFAFTGFGAVALAYVVVRYLVTGAAVPGFAFLASTIAIFSGVQLFAMGIFGEYLARMHTRLLGQPCYVVRQTTHAAPGGNPPAR